VPEKTFIESAEEIETLLHEETVGFLGLSVDGMPYVVPLSYCYADGRIIFHGALTGKKLDLIGKNPEVCFTVARQAGPPVRHEGACELETDSVICYGKARILDDLEERRKALDLFNRRFTPFRDEITPERASRCSAVEIVVREATGRRERGEERTFWRHRFESRK
jgi:nitroimidazol reductase NimA-like FMN-containing flavoprotein (pyridoxamine 5'-phosphate oxidase superfamily)